MHGPQIFCVICFATCLWACTPERYKPRVEYTSSFGTFLLSFELCEGRNGFHGPLAVDICRQNERHTGLEIMISEGIWRKLPTKGLRLKYLPLLFFKQRQTLRSPYDNSRSSVLSNSFVDSTMVAPCYMTTPFTLRGVVYIRAWACVVLACVNRIGIDGVSV